jgi:hypothetical protein
MACLTKPQFDIVGEYIRNMADALGLRDWHLFLKYEPPDDAETGAMVVPIEGRKHASIYLCEDFRDLKPENQREYIVHELLHLHFQPACDVIRADLWESNALSFSQHRQVWESFKRLMEYGVDGVTEHIAGFFPLIEWGDDE